MLARYNSAIHTAAINQPEQPTGILIASPEKDDDEGRSFYVPFFWSSDADSARILCEKALEQFPRAEKFSVIVGQELVHKPIDGLFDWLNEQITFS